MRRFIKESTRAFGLGILIFIIRHVISLINGNTIDFDEELLLDLIFNQAFALVLYLANAYFVRFMLNRYKQGLFTFKEYDHCYSVVNLHNSHMYIYTQALYQGYCLRSYHE